MFLMFEDNNPIVVAIHCESGVRTDALNKGAPCGPSYRRHVLRKKTDSDHYQMASYTSLAICMTS